MPDCISGFESRLFKDWESLNNVLRKIILILLFLKCEKLGMSWKKKVFPVSCAMF
jgi:hypothetical protein